MTNNILPSSFTAPIGNLWRAIGHGTKAVEIFSSMLEDTAVTTKEITSLSLGAKCKQLAADLAVD